MSGEDVLAVIRDELARLAPEIDFDAVDQNRSIQREFDIDSMDFLNFITALHERLGVNVPEADYARVATISGAERYLVEELKAKDREAK
jgi:acyl carrier protein